MAIYSAPSNYKDIFNSLDYSSSSIITNSSNNIYTGFNTFSNVLINGSFTSTMSSFFNNTVTMLSPPILSYTTMPTFVNKQVGQIISASTLSGSITSLITGNGTSIDLTTPISLSVGIWLIEITADYTSRSASNTIGLENISTNTVSATITSQFVQELNQITFGTNSLSRRVKYTQIMPLVNDANVYAILRLDYATTGGFFLGSSRLRAIRIA
jgi:hypothetical protein